MIICTWGGGGGEESTLSAWLLVKNSHLRESRAPYWPRENQKIPTSLRGIRRDFPVKKLATRFFSGGNQDPEFPQGSLGGAIPEYTQNGQSG